MKAQLKKIDGQAVVGFMVVYGLGFVAVGMSVFSVLALR